MGASIFSALQYLWPFSLWKVDDLKTSERLVQGLSIPEHTKQFVFAFHEPDTQNVVYVLAVQNLSQQSAVDTRCLINEVKPRAVLAQVSPSALHLQKEEIVRRNSQLNTLPTSWFSVVIECFVNKMSKEDYENLAESQIIKAIFGVEFYGHLLAAKNAAEETGSQFTVVESLSGRNMDSQNVGVASDSLSSSLLLQPNGLVSGKAVPAISSISKRFMNIDNLRPQMMNSLVAALSNSIPEPLPSEIAPSSVRSFEHNSVPANYQAPSFARSVYLLLADLHDIFIDLPAIKKAFFYAQKMLVDVHRGEPVDSQLLASVHNFRLAVEGLRIALNGVARDPKVDLYSNKTNFNELPMEEKCHALLAHAVKIQAKNYTSMVAIVDASSLVGLRRHWKTNLPPEIEEQVAHSLVSGGVNNETIWEGSSTRMRSLTEKPVVAVGAGATAIIGATSFSKAVPISAVTKLVTVNIPASLKIGLVQTQRTLAIGLAKVFGPSKILAPWMGSSGTKVTAMKAAASAEKFRAVAHSLVASAERSSLQAMRTAFYEIMRRRGRTIGARPWIAFGCSVVTCSGLLLYGDGIECAAESAPSAHSIASMGRGLRSLHEASEALSCGDEKMQDALKSLRTRLQTIKH